MAWPTWREATERALYGAGRLLPRASQPADHFRTVGARLPALRRGAARAGPRQPGWTPSSTSAPAAASCSPPCTASTRPDACSGSTSPPARRRCPTPIGLDARDARRRDRRPAGRARVARRRAGRRRRAHRARLAAACSSTRAPGDERLGPPPAERPRLAGTLVAGQQPGDRAEVGRPRDEAWAGVVSALRRRARRRRRLRARPRRPPSGRQPHRLPRRPPGAAGPGRQLRRHQPCGAGRLRGGRRAGRRDLRRCSPRQRAALAGCSAYAGRGRRTSWPTATRAAYLRALSAAGELAELTDPHGLGGFGWLVQGVGSSCQPGLPQRLTGTDE